MVVNIDMSIEKNREVSQTQKRLVVAQKRIYELTGSDIIDALLDLLNGYLEGWYIMPEEVDKNE